ncbi:platelet endothelial cell adhesion molecule isoform X2 [Alosa alosa]|uniref:platelet endothelial cell adhesion molecule isoform X2 n=1 Tax=Alosa alosa TaxID=278164 RepID=UPI0020153352|nr:platelet endothelial cell adhesion molecule isoform X2 [Alosa alosa]
MWDHQRPSHRMATCNLLFLLLFTCQRVKAEFSIDDLSLTFDPGADVGRDTNVTVTCHATVSRSQGFTPQYEFSIEKDNKVVNRTTSTSDTFDYPIKAARVSDSGGYQCRLSIQGKKKSSKKETLTITGTQTPQISVDSSSIMEGDEVTATCRAPGERGAFTYYFYVGDQEAAIRESNIEESSVKLQLSNSGRNNLTCQYFVSLLGKHMPSSVSTPKYVFVKEIAISVSLAISPSMEIIEADNFSASCVVNSSPRSETVSLIMGKNILSQGRGRVDYSAVAKANDSGEYMCKVEVNGVAKTDKKMLMVKELFSKPRLIFNPEQAFEGEFVRLSCESTNLERIKKEDIKYSIYKNNYLQPMGNINGQMVIQAGPSGNDNYHCMAEAKSISKKSDVIIFRSKVLASKPDIFVKQKVILGEKFDIYCKSNGTLPITYTLYQGGKKLQNTTIYDSWAEARFNTSIKQKEHIGTFRCRAQNDGSKNYSDSLPLSAVVVEHLGKPLLTTLPVPHNVEEGQELTLICNVPSGTPPITFKWFSSGSKTVLHTKTVNANSSHHVIPQMEKTDSGEYYCHALNAANAVDSDRVIIQVKLASWKKVVIVGICLLVVAALVVVIIARYKAKRGKRETTTELSVKPASPKSDDTLAVNMSPDTPFLNKVGVNVGPSVWTERPSSSDSSDRSSVHSHNDPDVEYTEVVHPQPVDPARDPSEHVDNGAVEYAELNHDLPEPVD